VCNPLAQASEETTAMLMNNLKIRVLLDLRAPDEVLNRSKIESFTLLLWDSTDPLSIN
jgi:hypothetical protein